MIKNKTKQNNHNETRNYQGFRYDEGIEIFCEQAGPIECLQVKFTAALPE
ncbi:hypothetical protein [Candidatus Nitrosocosmicus sp. SS]|nr:hypothetical protein [Candidatus Nitrosocosmicus sp. SS]